MYFITLFFAISWVLGMLLTIKVDRMFTEEPFFNKSIILDLFFALFLWYIVAIAQLVTKHKVI